ncbi:LytR/AlgR family response regulator transcription factor [Aquimarina macrocephali]|uniref:LytR/AlgR family response regulator transcription factor n=1 Tax=Aquimarina macrocephali TaxID=666563 RepID=UPI0004644D04|nr:response regulator transcription factor [Aquimarina macrocephali]
MKVAIIEDEPLAAEKLERYLLKYDSDIQVIGKLASIEEAVLWIDSHQEEVDLFFMDVQLIDGLSFEIFNKVKVNKPVIFTTAFDEFAIDAFKVNSIDYLLKPVLFTDLSKALKKLETLRSQFLGGISVSHAVKSMTSTVYKNRFLVRLGNHIHSVKSEDISFFFAEGRDAYLVAENRKKYMIEYKLETLEELLEPKSFFRVNRTFIVNINAIEDVLVYSNRRLKLTLSQNIDKEVIVSREKVTDFKQWFEGN